MILSIVIAVLLCGMASLSGLAVSARLPWSEAARQAQVDRAVGLAIGPLLAGLCAVVALWLLPGLAHSTHLGLVLAALAAGAPFGLQLAMRGGQIAGGRGRFERLARWLLLAFVAAMVFDFAVVPLIQNDALEYATVGRILYEARDLAAYPAINPAATASGFFGPWTHPPLYVSLIYLADAIQGQADSAKALRFIAPWFLVASMLCVLALGRIHSVVTGVVAAVIFVSTPILFLGATSALIDPLPVLGLTVCFAGLVGFTGSWLRRGAAIGLLLGLALWTHSQAILFPCLLLPLLWLRDGAASTPGLRPRLFDALRSAAAALLVMLVVGGAPYARNMLIFGSPISDNPEVFAYAPLGFADYFRMQRGISDPVEIIQYGVLKGFFSIEAYSLAFWLALLGMPTAWRALRRQLRRGDSEVLTPDLLRAVALAVFLMYTGATALSASLGIDLMIRNERYLLVLIPVVALLGAAGLVRATTAIVTPTGRSRRGLLGLVFLLMPAQLVVLVSYRQSQLRGEMIAWDEASQIQRWPPFMAMNYLRSATPADAVVLTMKPSDMFYASRRMLSYLDPRMIAFYAERSSPAAALGVLQRLGVTHVHVPDYFLPPMYMSKLMNLLADPTATKLLSDTEGYQIYALRKEPLPQQASADAAGGLTVPAGWERVTQAVLAGRKSRARITLRSEPYTIGTVSVNDGFAGLFHRESGRAMVSSAIRLPDQQAQCGNQQRELTAEVRISGHAHVQVLALLHDSGGRVIERRVLGDRPALGKRAETLIQRRTEVSTEVAAVKLFVEHRGASQMTLHAATLRLACSMVAP